MGEQTTLEKTNTNIRDRIYINYTKYSVQTKLTEGRVIVYKEPEEKIPFRKQEPIEVLTIKEFEEKYKEKIIREQEEIKKEMWM